MSEARNESQIDHFVIHNSEITVGDLIKWLATKDSRQKIKTQVILPEGQTAWNPPINIFDVPESNCGNGLPYLGMQIKCYIEKNDG